MPYFFYEKAEGIWNIDRIKVWRLENKWYKGANDIENSPFAPTRGGNVRDDLALSSRTVENSIGRQFCVPREKMEKEKKREGGHATETEEGW